MLYVIATPIGNMGDISQRAIETLKSVDFVAAEDTRVGGKLLMLLGIKKPLVSYFEHNKSYKGDAIIKRLLSGETCALISDAGTPAISDPGAELVAECHSAGIKVVPIPGCCAAATAISAGGLKSKKFIFEGFLSESKKERSNTLEELKSQKRDIVFYSPPHGIEKDMKDIFAHFGDREVAICRELTKLNETITKTSLSNAINMIKSGEIPQKGEFAIVVSGAMDELSSNFWEGMSIEEHLKYYLNIGYKKMDAVKAVSLDRKIPKGQVYQISLEI
jgi:16S rRNA (cytidine1402-2'-O)-methyltransferase